MERSGYIKLHRQSLDSRVFASEALWKVFTWCLLRATWKEQHVPVNLGRGASIVTLKPGQILFGRRSAAEELGMTPSSVRNRMDRLAAMGCVSVESRSHYSVVTVVNWEQYQGEGESEVKVDEVVKAEPVKPKSPPQTYPGFDRFWKAYPGERKYGKKKCREKWKSRGFEQRTDEVLAGVERWKKSADWKKEGGKFIPAPEVFLNQERWEADVKEQQTFSMLGVSKA